MAGITDQTLGPRAQGANYERFRDALAKIESSNNPGAIQRRTKAVGLFQFIPRWWNKWVKENTGEELSSYLPKDKSKKEIERARSAQLNKLFPAYYEKDLYPFVAQARKVGMGKNLTDMELAGIYHKLGRGAAMKFLKTGHDASEGTPDNEPIRDYVGAILKKAGAHPSRSMQVSKPLFRKDRAPRKTGTPEAVFEEQEYSVMNLGSLDVATKLRSMEALPSNADNEAILKGLELLNQRLGAASMYDDARERNFRRILREASNR